MSKRPPAPPIGDLAVAHLPSDTLASTVVAAIWGIESHARGVAAVLELLARTKATRERNEA